MSDSLEPAGTQRPLDSDHLGKKGENRFDEICVDAMLFPNKSYYDRTGWDYVVDWPHLPGPWAFDQRPTPISCMVQTKTIWAETDSITFLVSSLERLAKDLRPSFVFVMRVNNDLDFVGGHIIHVEGEFLAHLLRRLREIQIEGKQPNNVNMSVSLAKWASPHAISGRSFRASVESMIGGSMSDYAARKTRQLRDLGYEKGRMRIKAKVDADSIDDMTDALLGLKPIRVSSYERHDMRFDLPLPDPVPSFSKGRLEFSPEPYDRGEIILSGSIEEAPVRFKVDMYRFALNFASGSHGKILLRSPLFRMVLTIERNEQQGLTTRLQFSEEGDYLNSARLSAATWRDFFRMVSWIVSGRLEIEIAPKKQRETISAIMNTAPVPEQVGMWQKRAELAEAAHALFERAGGAGTGLTWLELAEEAERILTLHAMIVAPSTLGPLTFTTTFRSEIGAGIPTDVPAPIDMLYFNCIPFGKHRIVFAAVLDLKMAPTGDQEAWTATGAITRIFAVKRLPNREEHYDRFIEACRSSAGIMSYFALTLGGAG